MASSCVQRCGSSNKEPFNFNSRFYKEKRKAGGRRRNSVSPHACALSLMGRTAGVSHKRHNRRQTLYYCWNTRDSPGGFRPAAWPRASPLTRDVLVSQMSHRAAVQTKTRPGNNRKLEGQVGHRERHHF